MDIKDEELNNDNNTPVILDNNEEKVETVEATEAEIVEAQDNTLSIEAEKKPNRKKHIIWVLIALLATVVTFVVIFNFNDFNATINELTHVDGVNMWYAVICLFIYFLTYPLSTCLIAKRSKCKASFMDSYFIGATEHFFNGITPFSTGGQPIQVYLYTKRKVKPSESTGIIATNFIAFLVATNIYAIVSLFFYGQFSANFTDATRWMIILGFAMNLFTLAFIILICTCSFVRKWLVSILRLICKWKFIGKYVEKSIPAFEEYCANTQIAAKMILKSPITFIGAILLRIISLAFYYVMPFFILRALGVDVSWNVLPLIMLASSFAITTMVWVPTPGGTGGIEFAFTTIFTITAFGAISSSVGVTGMVLWRFLTYYVLMILSFITYISFNIAGKRKVNKDA